MCTKGSFLTQRFTPSKLTRYNNGHRTPAMFGGRQEVGPTNTSQNKSEHHVDRKIKIWKLVIVVGGSIKNGHSENSKIHLYL